MAPRLRIKSEIFRTACKATQGLTLSASSARRPHCPSTAASPPCFSSNTASPPPPQGLPSLQLSAPNAPPPDTYCVLTFFPGVCQTRPDRRFGGPLPQKTAPTHDSVSLHPALFFSQPWSPLLYVSVAPRFSNLIRPRRLFEKQFVQKPNHTGKII